MPKKKHNSPYRRRIPILRSFTHSYSYYKMKNKFSSLCRCWCYCSFAVCCVYFKIACYCDRARASFAIYLVFIRYLKHLFDFHVRAHIPRIHFGFRCFLILSTFLAHSAWHLSIFIRALSIAFSFGHMHFQCNWAHAISIKKCTRLRWSCARVRSR